MKKAVLFDLDGTLLDTLQDLMEAVNYTCRQYGFPTHSYAAIRSFVGNGVKKLVERAIPEQEHGRFDEVFDTFKQYYEAHMEDKTAPYEGVLRLLARLKAEGYATAVVSNKFDSAVQALSAKYFPALIDVAVGESETVRAKPAPDAPLLAMKTLGVTAEECLYVGDSDVDVVTARACGVADVAVTWGFKDREVLVAAGASRFADTPEALYGIICAHFN